MGKPKPRARYVDGHDVNSEHCPCGPDVLQLCPTCGGKRQRPGEPPRGCPECKGSGLVPEYDETRPSVIVHQEGEVARGR